MRIIDRGRLRLVSPVGHPTGRIARIQIEVRGAISAPYSPVPSRICNLCTVLKHAFFPDTRGMTSLVWYSFEIHKLLKLATSVLHFCLIPITAYEVSLHSISIHPTDDLAGWQLENGWPLTQFVIQSHCISTKLHAPLTRESRGSCAPGVVVKRCVLVAVGLTSRPWVQSPVEAGKGRVDRRRVWGARALPLSPLRDGRRGNG